MNVIDPHALMTPARTGFMLAFLSLTLTMFAQLPLQYGVVPVVLGLVIALCEPLRHMSAPRQVFMLMVWPFGLAAFLFFPFLAMIAAEGAGFEATLREQWALILNLGVILYGLGFITLSVGQLWSEAVEKHAGRFAFLLKAVPVEFVMYGFSTILMSVVTVLVR